MGLIDRVSRTTGLAGVCAASIALLAAGCGGEDDEYANEPRPPAPVVVSASISGGGISVSPRELGAGPVELIVTNQTQRPQELRLETDEVGGSAPGLRQQSGPINPGDTARLKADLREGSYKIAIDGGEASLEVGDSRPSAQDELLTP